jgi:hypothetical protein
MDPEFEDWEYDYHNRLRPPDTTMSKAPKVVTVHFSPDLICVAGIVTNKKTSCGIEAPELFTSDVSQVTCAECNIKILGY